MLYLTLLIGFKLIHNNDFVTAFQNWHRTNVREENTETNVLLTIPITFTAVFIKLHLQKKTHMRSCKGEDIFMPL